MNSSPINKSPGLTGVKDIIQDKNETIPLIKEREIKERLEDKLKSASDKINLKEHLLKEESNLEPIIPELSFSELLELQLEVKKRMNMIDDKLGVMKEIMNSIKTNTFEVDKNIISDEIESHKKSLSKLLKY